MYDTVTAKHHVELMEALHSSCISRSVSESVMFKNKSFYTKKYKEGGMEIKVTNGDVINSILDATHRGKVCVINPGSYKTPGGKFLEGNTGKEETICANSTLYNVLSEFNSTYYNSNREFTNKLLYANKALYTPNILFADNNGVAGMADVLTCTPPNKYGAMRYREVTEDENRDSLLSRIDFILCIAEHMGVKNLILCDYGCSLYHQDPREVAEIFKSQFNKHKSYDYVEFSILGYGNYKIFKEVLR